MSIAPIQKYGCVVATPLTISIVSMTGVIEMFINRAHGLRCRSKYSQYVSNFLFIKLNLVLPTGIEPVTCCLEGSCSIQLSYGSIDRPTLRMSPYTRARWQGLELSVFSRR